MSDIASRARANQRFVVTGGPGAGKTTLLEALRARGHPHVPDSARAIIRRRRAAGQSPRPTPREFGREMLRLDIEGYRNTPAGHEPLFFDRCVLDALAFAKQHGDADEALLRRHVEAFRYNPVVFFCPPWEEIYCQDPERDQDFAEASAVFEQLSAWYRRWGYQTVEVPRGKVEERVRFVLTTVEQALAVR
jgi:predicted ATPase